METFRLYKLTAQGKIASGEWIEAEDLRAAIDAVKSRCKDQQHLCEIWQGTQRVANFACHGAADGGLSS